MVAKAERKFKSRTRTIANFAEAVWFFVIGDAIDRGELAPVKGWSSISVTPPRSLTVDSGRESEANRRDVDAGIKLVSDSYEEQGGDFMDAMRKKARLIKQVRELAEGEGIDPKTLFNFDSEKTIAQESGGNDEAPKNSESGGAPSGSPAKQ
jgi:capsid protein